MDGDTSRVGGLPTLAVLPFSAFGDQDEVALMAQGLTEDICGELTRFRSLRVIAPASAARLAGLTDAEIGARVGATHVLRGRLRASPDGDRMLTADLSVVTSQAQLWSERYALPEGDPAVVGEAIVARIAATLNARIEEAALAEARRQTAVGLDAWALTLRGLILIRDGTREADDAARALFTKALTLDPLYPRAHAGLAMSWFNEWSCQFWDRFDEASRSAYVHARRALELDDRDAMNHLIVAKVALFRSAWEQAAWYLDRALMLCPNDADLLVQAAVLEVYLGRPDAAVRHVDRAMALNPAHPNFYCSIAAYARVFAGDYEGALALCARSDEMPFVDFPAYVAVAAIMLGRTDMAKAEYARYVDEYRRKITFGQPFPPEAPLDWLFELNPFRRVQDVTMLRTAFARIGATTSEASSPRDQPPKAVTPALRLERSGEGWFIDFEGARTVLPGLKGLHDLKRLMDRPGEEIHCLDLDERIVETPGEAMLDEKARNALKARLRDLQEDLAEAEDGNDIGRAERLRTEMDGILETLGRAWPRGPTTPDRRQRRKGSHRRHLAHPPRPAADRGGTPHSRASSGAARGDGNFLSVPGELKCTGRIECG